MLYFPTVIVACRSMCALLGVKRLNVDPVSRYEALVSGKERFDFIFIFT